MRHKGWEGTIVPSKNAKAMVHTGMMSGGVVMCVCICSMVLGGCAVCIRTIGVISRRECVYCKHE